MKQTKILWDMPINVEIVDRWVTESDIFDIYNYFNYIDKVFSTFRIDSEISQINTGILSPEKYSRDMVEVLALCEQTKHETNGYFDIRRGHKIDPSGLVKGWAVNKAALKLKAKGFRNFYVDAGGDIQVSGNNSQGLSWSVGIRNPFNRIQNIKVIKITDKGIATSGTYIRGQHIYDPVKGGMQSEIISLTVIGPNVYEADRFATAAFAMGREGIKFLADKPNLSGYQIDNEGIATYTQNFTDYIK
jgi:FAD:protein FMN transferase